MSLSGIVHNVQGSSEDGDYTIIHVGPSIQRKHETKPVDNTPNTGPMKKEDGIKEGGKTRPMTGRQRHKAEKIKKKYRDQDDEERELRLMLLASKPKDKKKGTKISNP